MPSHLALLRGINVGGHNMVAMSDLKRLFIRCGCSDVTTYLQTGNVLFDASGALPTEAELEAAVAQDLAVTTRVLVRSREELAQICSNSPFAQWAGDPAQLYLAFLNATPDAQRVAEFSVPAGGSERFWIAGRQIYLQYPDGYGRTKLTNGYIEQRLGVVATTRNWRVTKQLAAFLNG
ncbi:MAG: DUF1697 domain-containing protein [Sulfobacillus sp.]